MAVFAILLPVTSRLVSGGDYQTEGPGLAALVARLDAVAEAVARAGPAHAATVTLGVDAGDTGLFGGVAAAPFARREVPVAVKVFPPPLVGRLCAMWNALAAAAVATPPGRKGGLPPLEPTYLLLLGDDVSVVAPAAAWGTAVVADFDALVDAGGPAHMGVVAAVDTTFPGFPTFPVVHRSHLDVFGGQLLPSEWEGASQGGDSYLFELHSRVGAAAFSSNFVVSNAVGGNAENAAAPPPRYPRLTLLPATVAAALDRGEATLRSYIRARDGVPLAPTPRFDVVVPCWRCDVGAVRAICTLPLPPRGGVTTFVVIIDNPDHPQAGAVAALEQECWAHGRRRVRVRLNDRNRGVSYSRNRGLKETMAPHVLFLDDDVVPDKGLLLAYAAAMANSETDLCRRAYAGVVSFPPATTPFHAALVATNLLYFFGAAADEITVPWGVTANLLLPAAALGVDPFDEGAPRGGGGEDILVCAALATAGPAGCNGVWPLISVPGAVVVHPWWEGSRRCYSHFGRWALGDGRLADLLPIYTYACAPNAPELLAALIVAAIPAVVVWGAAGAVAVAAAGAAVGVVDVALTWRAIAPTAAAATRDGRLRLAGGWAAWAVATVQAAALLWVVDGARLVGHAARWRAAAHWGRRFDWFLGSHPAAPAQERRRQATLCAAVGVAWAGMAAVWWAAALAHGRA